MRKNLVKTLMIVSQLMLSSNKNITLNILRTRSFSEYNFVPGNHNIKDIVKIFSGNLDGFLVQPLFLSVLGYNSQLSFLLSSMSFPFCKIL